ncbi:MAG: M20/M25/M40 family metallo-hydrolase [Cyanobacteriota bacterium]
MKVGLTYNANRADFRHLQPKNKNLTQGKIIHFTGKPTSQEVSDVLRIANKVSQESITKLLNEIAGPHTEGRGVGQKGIEIAKEYIGNKFKEYGLVPVKELGLDNYYQDFKIPQYPVSAMRRGDLIYGQLNRWGGNPDTISANVVGMMKGTEKPDEYIIICGHYDHLGKDTRTGHIFPGANDDASGVVGMLELARIMSEEGPPKKSVIFAALTGEESGWLGANNMSKELVKHGLAKQVEVMNIEMIAAVSGKKMDVWDQKMPEAQSMVQNIVKAGKELGTPVTVNNAVDPGSDSIRFSSYGIPAVCMAWDLKLSEIRKNHPTYHCAEDTPENINKKIFYEAARLAAASGYLIANDTTPRLKPIEQDPQQLQQLELDRMQEINSRQPL